MPPSQTVPGRTNLREVEKRPGTIRQIARLRPPSEHDHERHRRGDNISGSGRRNLRRDLQDLQKEHPSYVRARGRGYSGGTAQ